MAQPRPQRHVVSLLSHGSNFCLSTAGTAAVEPRPKAGEKGGEPYDCEIKPS